MTQRIRPLSTVPIAATFIAGLVMPGAVVADGRDHDRALAARQAAAIRPLAELLPPVEAAQRGRVIGVELDEEDGLLVYELRLIRDDGSVTEVMLDAATGAVIEVEDADDDRDDTSRRRAPTKDRR